MTSLHDQQRRTSAPAARKGDDGTVTVHRAFRYRLYPTEAQEAVLGQYSGVCRLVYNLALEQRRDYWRQYRRIEGRSISFVSQSAELTLLRAAFDWIAAVPVTAETYALRDVDRAFANFFAGRTKYPTPRRRDHGHGFRFKGSDTHIIPHGERMATVYVPKLGDIRFRLTRPIRGTVRSVSINCKAGAWHVSLAAEWEETRQQAAPGAVGIDLGVAQTVTLSTGVHRNLPPQDAAGRAVAKAQRDLARKKRGSARYKAQLARVARLRAKAARVRADWSHKLSTEIAGQYGLVAIEDLKIPNMTASAAGTVEAPGKMVAQKRGLNRAILDQGWGGLRTMLAYKVEHRGGTLVAVDPKFTSQTCAACGVVDAKSRKSQAAFDCVHCGHTDNADVNAALEILRRASPLHNQAGGSET